jgi:two-component system sensor histidine kinase PilS (NtrC family)
VSVAADAALAETELNRVLRLLAWARLGVAQLLLLLAPVLPPDLVPAANRDVLTVTVLGVVASSIALLVVGPVTRPQRAAWLLCVLDVVLVTGVVAATGGPRSIYSFLYVLSVAGASLLLPRAGTLAMAGLGSLLYAGLVTVRTRVPLTMLLDPPEETTALDVLTMFLNSGTFLVVAVVAGGLTERYRTTRLELESQRRDLRDLQAFKAVVLQSVGAGFIVLDRLHTVTALNPAAEELTGWRARDAIGRPWAAVFGDLTPVVAAEAALAEAPLTSSRYETVLHRPDGQAVPVRLSFSALRAQDGRGLGLVAVCEDLSAMREMEARMRQADRLATLGRMAANMAHEIRNPLASMAGAVEALTGETLTPAERQRLSQIVGRESERLNHTIRDFLEYARPAPVRRVPLDVAALLDEILLLLEHQGLPPGLKIVREFPDSLPWLLDGQQVRQAVWNLCLNSVEAMPSGGELRVSAAAEGRQLLVTVSDTGHGIPDGELAHVFEPFHTTKPGGTGLGLALVHRVAQDHGGWIDLRSVPGVGTTAVLVLPRNTGLLGGS